MSIRRGLLALLTDGAKYGAQLRTEFETRTGGTWPLNVGQVYTTLARLERDGLVEGDGGPDEEGRIRYRLTAPGREEADRWWITPIDRDSTPRNELAIKLALAVTVPDVDVPRIVQTQRTATMRQLRDLTRLKVTGQGEGSGTDGAGDGGLSWRLVLENLIYQAESEIRWLDHVEAAVARAAAEHRAAAAGAAPAAAPPRESGRPAGTVTTGRGR